MSVVHSFDTCGDMDYNTSGAGVSCVSAMCQCSAVSVHASADSAESFGAIYAQQRKICSTRGLDKHESCMNLKL